MALGETVVVVGAGSAGCTVAKQLSDRCRVMLIDAGPLEPAGVDVTALGRLPIEPGASRVLRYQELRGRDVVRGTGLGGSSAVNGGYFLRGHVDDYADWPWSISELDSAFSAVETVMSVSPFGDDELGDLASAFEEYWQPRVPAAPGPWAAPGLIRVRSNRRAGRRVTAGQMLGTAVGVERATVTGLTMKGGRVTGVETEFGHTAADKVVLTAGTLGTAALLTALVGDLPIHEHPELLVRFDLRRGVRAPALLQSVLHTGNGLEIRCYGDDFARFIRGLPRAGAAIGVADMAHATRGTVGTAGLDLGVPDAASSARMADGAERVAAMLHSSEFADLVEPGSVRIDETVGMSSHAWGTVPQGTGIDGLYVADGSILPGPLRSGPHATIMAVAALVAETI